ncbi:MAG: hypothetical protein WBQ44_12375 [Rhodococcus sp. (in: high G+C Gram-positive bacteria)]
MDTSVSTVGQAAALLFLAYDGDPRSAQDVPNDADLEMYQAKPLLKQPAANGRP